MSAILISLGAALAISICCTPFVRILATRFNVFAAPNGRTIHAVKIPKLGGLAIYFAFAAGILAYGYTTTITELMYTLLIGGAVITLVGMLDDIYDLNCYAKLSGQILAGMIAAKMGFDIKVVSLPFIDPLPLGMWSLPISVFWIVCLMNAVNLIDGLDGLAAGFSAILSVLIMIFAILYGRPQTAMIAAVLAVAALGFLRHNLVRARIFMGDSGSLFLGFTLACLATQAFSFPGTGMNLAILATAFALPLADTLLAIVRRLSAGKHPFSADKKHIHHLLLERGFAQTSAVLAMCSAAVLLGLTCLALTFVTAPYAIAIFAAVYVLFFCALFLIGCFDFIVEPGKLRRMRPIRSPR